MDFCTCIFLIPIPVFLYGMALYCGGVLGLLPTAKQFIMISSHRPGARSRAPPSRELHSLITASRLSGLKTKSSRIMIPSHNQTSKSITYVEDIEKPGKSTAAITKLPNPLTSFLFWSCSVVALHLSSRVSVRDLCTCLKRRHLFFCST